MTLPRLIFFPRLLPSYQHPRANPGSRALEQEPLVQTETKRTGKRGKTELQDFVT